VRYADILAVYEPFQPIYDMKNEPIAIYNLISAVLKKKDKKFMNATVSFQEGIYPHLLRTGLSNGLRMKMVSFIRKVFCSFWITIFPTRMIILKGS
jgi:hypothetical protein